MLYEPVSLLAVHHAEHAHLMADARKASPSRAVGWRLRQRLHGVSVFVLRRAYVRARASYVAAGRPA